MVDGEFHIGLTFEEAAALYAMNGYPVEVVYPKEGTIVRPDGAALIKGTDNRSEGELFIDFITSYDIQRLIALSLNRRSIRKDVSQSESLRD